MLKKLLNVAVIAASVVLIVGCEAVNKIQKKTTSAQKPNIVVIFADDLGFGDIESFGAQGISTPNIDSIGKDGFISRDFFIPANVCSPSRASILTGRYPMRNGTPVAVNASDKHRKNNYGLHPDEITIPEILKPAGYRSLMVGKWHLGFEGNGTHPLNAGFDEHFGLQSNFYHAVESDIRYETLKNLNTLYRGHEIVKENVNLEEVTQVYTDEVISFIEREKDSPFFVYFSHHIVHAPHKPSKEFVGTSEKGKYGDFIHELDHSTGRVLDTLKKLGLEENTLVIFTSDNGANYAGSNGELNGVKYTTMEGGHIVPAMFKWPRVIPKNLDSDITLTSMDLLPIFADIAGAALPKNRTIDGQNTLDILQGKNNTSPHKVLYYYNGTNLQAVRKGRWKLHLPRTLADQPFWHENSKGRRIHTELDEVLLFDLATDRGEKTNVAAQYPEIVASFDSEILHARTVLGDVDMVGTDQRVPPMENPQKIDRWWIKKK